MSSKSKYIYEWPRPMVTVDVVVFSGSADSRRVLLIRRKHEPYKDKWAFPGGFVNIDEQLAAAAERELAEETGLTGINLEQLCTFGSVGRDPRGRVISVVYVGFCEDTDCQIKSGDDAAEARWFDIDNLPEMAFDHGEMAAEALHQLASGRDKKIYKNVQSLNDLSWGYRSACVLQTAVIIGLFEVLSEKPTGLGEICRRCGTKPDMTEKLVIACTALGLIEKEGSLYRNSELSQTYLVCRAKLYQGNMIAHSANAGAFWANLSDNIFDEGVEKPQRNAHRDFILGMHNITMAGRGKIFLDNIDLSGRQKLLDVGGGPGTYSIMACRHYPQLTAVVFDLPETISITKEIITKQGMQEHVSVQEGNWETDEFGRGYDVVLMSNILHGAASRAEMKLAKAHKSMDEGGLLVVQEFLLNNDKSGPLVPALFNVMVGAYSEEELLFLIENAGFIGPKVVTIDEGWGCGWIIALKRA
jgi:ADP-ribose pyrophosphatase YjhB (NUDIX family)